MVSETSRRASFFSTGVVAKALGLDQPAVRAMIDAGTLPEPGWMNLGKRDERVYSLEWLVLANQQLNGRRLSGLELHLPTAETVQLALRFDQRSWTLSEVVKKLAALEELWDLCAETVADGDELVPRIQVRRLAAGSPLDLLAWISANAGNPGTLTIGAAATLFIYTLKNPDKVGEAIPRLVAAWHKSWAAADRAAIERRLARVDRRKFESEASRITHEIDAIPSSTALTGNDTTQLESVRPAKLEAAKDEAGTQNEEGA